ncbi:MAG: helix-turn-helix transcriptional regulator [Pseudolabrys sp.]|nr:helix-turn-helix transcriptional regulator [Pseudolabrys sp.]
MAKKDIDKNDMEIVRGSGNVFRDFGRPNADLEQARAILAVRIVKALDERKLTARAAEKLTGVAHTDLSRIRNAKLERFTLDRMITILGKLDRDVEVSIRVAPRSVSGPAIAAVVLRGSP